MFRVLIVAGGSEGVRELGLALAEKGFLCSIASPDDDRLSRAGAISADLVVIDVEGAAAESQAMDLVKQVKQRGRLPVVALLSKGDLELMDSAAAAGADVDDFALAPWDTAEVIARISRILQRRPEADNPDLVRCGDIAIDAAKCEVAFKGRLVDLTFKEYELLRFLVNHKGKVFSRESLLNSVWGYDYFGGDRTVDVHIRRLRSKLDDTECIETVRNIGYRCREDA